MSIFVTLKNEHRLIRRYLDNVSVVLEFMEQTKLPPKEFFELGLEFCKLFADKFHHFKEEYEMFMLLAQKKEGEIDAHIAYLRDQHERARNFTAEISKSLERYGSGDSFHIANIQEFLGYYNQLLRQHIHREDHIFYPLAHEVFNKEDLKRLSENFKKAEALHEKFYDVDPMALMEIVRSGEIIEQEKSQSLDQAHLDIWTGLYNSMSTAEENALYYSMKSKIFEPGEPIMDQGKQNSRLYFINKGEVKAIYQQGDKEIFINTVGPGNIIGQDAFFSATICTVSMIPLNSVEVTYLETGVLKKWKKDVPALESKLYDYCMKHDLIRKELENKEIDRREDERVGLAGKLKFQLLDKAEKPLGRGYSGEISDISAGGLSFIIKSSKKESLRMLLGRRLKVCFKIPLKNQNYRKVDQAMRVIAAQPQVFDDYSVHLKFDVKWAQKMINEIDASRLALKLGEPNKERNK